MYEKSQVRTCFSVEEPPLVSVIVELFFSLFFNVSMLQNHSLYPAPSSESVPSFLPFLKHIFPHQTRIVCGSRPWNSSTCSYAVERAVCADELVVQVCSFPVSGRRRVHAVCTPSSHRPLCVTFTFKSLCKGLYNGYIYIYICWDLYKKYIYMKNLLFNERISSQLPTWRFISVTFDLLLSVLCSFITPSCSFFWYYLPSYWFYCNEWNSNFMLYLLYGQQRKEKRKKKKHYRCKAEIFFFFLVFFLFPPQLYFFTPLQKVVFFNVSRTFNSDAKLGAATSVPSEHKTVRLIFLRFYQKVFNDELHSPFAFWIVLLFLYTTFYE